MYPTDMHEYDILRSLPNICLILNKTYNMLGKLLESYAFGKYSFGVRKSQIQSLLVEIVI